MQPTTDIPTTSITAALPPARSWPGRFFGVVVRGQTLLNIVYLALCFPLGLLYFVFLVTMLGTGLGLAITLVGIALLIATMLAWWAFAAFERVQADFLLGTDFGHAPRPWRHADSAWERLKALIVAPSTWKDLAFLLLKFPLGVVTFTALTVAGAVPLWLVTAPLHYRFDRSYDPASGQSVPGMSLGFWTIDTLPEALVVMPIGLLLFFVALHLLNALAHIWRMMVTLLLAPAASATPGDGR